MKYQVVVLAGGDSTRFYPFNNLHKSFFQLAGKTILERTIENIKKTDPLDIIVVLGAKNFEEEKKICNQIDIFEGVKYVSQSKASGQADAILTAEKYVKNDFFVINAQQFNFDTVAREFVETHGKSGNLATVGVVKTDNPHKYGIVSLKGDKVTGVIEKPEKGREPSDMRLVGIYLFSADFMQELKKAPVSEYSLEETLNRVSGQDKTGFVTLDEVMPSLKYPWDILTIKDQILLKLKLEISQNAKIEKTSVIRGDNIYFGKGAHVCDFAIIEGPAYIGENAVVGAYCQIRRGSVLEEGAQVERYTDVKNSYIGKGTHIHSGFVGDSVIGANSRIGAGFIVANKRLDRMKVSSTVKGEKVDTGLTSFGVAIGYGVHIGIRVSAMPGSMVGSMSNIYPNITLKGFIPEKSNIKQ